MSSLHQRRIGDRCVEAGVCCTCTDDHASSGVGWLLFALFCFLVATYAFFVVFIAVQIWLAAQIVLRLCGGKFIRAAIWACILVFLLHIDVVIWF
jgi:hypothetical protein